MAMYDPAFRELKDLLKSPEIADVNPDVKKKLEHIKELFARRHFYADENTSTQSESLAKLFKDTYDHPWKDVHKQGKTQYYMEPFMISGQVTIKFLQFIISMVKAKRVLEIGMFTGYTALGMAEALPSDGVLHTCDVEPYLVEFTKPYFDQSPHGKKIKVHIAPALETIPKLHDEGLQFDVVFIDADKPGYKGYVEMIMKKNMLAPNGIILADNSFFQGDSYTKEDDPTVNPMHDFNKFMASQNELERVLLPIRDGILAVKRKSEVLNH
ncbi:hypothetical protein LOTGIDRAFT_230086 [Lottia gigantea]|uniref:Caffeoyl-CoA O-methyltransferase n=1 Tax=Lottia gigantea TaxID=225164 RepID=V4B3T1_LOTGI|nr:hypothetical protein LOTGIDRAFT_230086 [Lottia gigantea]ESP05053.1 hypothetical protein LOTGIDRAFT_230086 [Lottia gigantea]